jgi:GTP-binding protein EngB required for normal cell division
MTVVNGRSEPSRPEVESEESQDIAVLLKRITETLKPVRASTPPIVERFDTLRARLLNGRLQLALLGQFKRGKSTLLNALLGAPLLPAGVIPLTAIPTFIAWGSTPRIRVSYRLSGRPQEFNVGGPDEVRAALFNFVAEEANPKNHLDVARVDVFYPAPILKTGVVLIDTPGIGSTHRHNTDTALAVLPECDAALFVVSVDPPITEAELAYLKMVRSNVARVFFVLNKVDYLESPDLQTAVEFLRRTLRQSAGGANENDIFSVSALSGLRARQHNDLAAFERSGIAALENDLLRHLAQEKRTMLREAVVQKAMQNLTEVQGDLSFTLRALEMPVEELRRCGGELEKTLLRLRGDAHVVHDLLAGDRRRILDQLERHAEALRERSRELLSSSLEQALNQSHDRDIEGPVQTAIEAIVPTFFEQELQDSLREFGQLAETVWEGHQKRVDDLVNEVRRAAAELLDVPYTPATESEGFSLPREPYWVTHQWADRLVTIPTGVVSRILPQPIRRVRLRAQIGLRITELVQRNVENLRWATLQGIEETFRRFSTALDDRFVRAIEATQGAIQAASQQRGAASEGAALELAQLRQASKELDEIRIRLGDIALATPDKPGDTSLG